MKFKSGKYTGYEIEEVAQKNPNYLKFLLRLDNLNPVLRKNIISCLYSTTNNSTTNNSTTNNSTTNNSKVEKLIKESLLCRGWSEGETEQMIQRLKNNS